MSIKTAVTFFDAVMATVHVLLFVLSQPAQFKKAEPDVVVAVRVTEVFCAYDAVPVEIYYIRENIQSTTYRKDSAPDLASV